MVAFILLVVGGLNWGLVGINPDWNVVELLGATLAKVVYILVGLAAISEVVTHKTNCKNCSAGSTGM
ncbi:MAG: DUF378 domain-containing protein [bacterium]|nr:DUF378 domain-containing protein [bacterium]